MFEFDDRNFAELFLFPPPPLDILPFPTPVIRNPTLLVLPRKFIPS